MTGKFWRRNISFKPIYYKLYPVKHNSSDSFRFCTRIIIRGKRHTYRYRYTSTSLVHIKGKIAILHLLCTARLKYIMYWYMCIFQLILILKHNLNKSEPLYFPENILEENRLNLLNVKGVPHILFIFYGKKIKRSWLYIYF